MTEEEAKIIARHVEKNDLIVFKKYNYRLWIEEKNSHNVKNPKTDKDFPSGSIITHSTYHNRDIRYLKDWDMNELEFYKKSDFEHLRQTYIPKKTFLELVCEQLFDNTYGNSDDIDICNLDISNWPEIEHEHKYGNIKGEKYTEPLGMENCAVWALTNITMTFNCGGDWEAPRTVKIGPNSDHDGLVVLEHTPMEGDWEHGFSDESLKEMLLDMRSKEV
jgi:hypothetical protein